MISVPSDCACFFAKVKPLPLLSARRWPYLCVFSARAKVPAAQWRLETMMYHPHRHFAPLLTIWLLACTLPFACHAQTNTYDPALALRLAEVKSKVPPGFTIVAQPPFIVIGDESSDMGAPTRRPHRKNDGGQPEAGLLHERSSRNH